MANNIDTAFSYLNELAALSFKLEKLGCPDEIVSNGVSAIRDSVRATYVRLCVLKFDSKSPDFL